MTKEDNLKNIISSYGKLAVAFSGGTDSTLLSRISHDLLGDNMIASHVVSPMSSKRESRFAENFAKKEGIPFKKIIVDPLKNPDIRNNTSKRCYHCKKSIVNTIKREISDLGIEIIADGTNIDDYNDFRPGIQAANELGVKHPLAEAKFDKKDIRDLSKKLNLENWNLPSSACMASRIPFNTPLDTDLMSNIEACENFLTDMKFIGCRVRALGETAKIELQVEQFEKAVEMADEIVEYIKKKGFQNAVLDLEGYRQGALNPKNT